MKFKNTETPLDFDEIERKQKKKTLREFTATWAETMIECSAVDVPIVSKIKRGSGRGQVSFTTYRNVVDDTQIIFENHPEIFQSRSEVDRACHYIGRGILKAIFQISKIKTSVKANIQTLKFLDEVEKVTGKIHGEIGIIGIFIDSIFKLHESFKLGVLSGEEMDNKISGLVKCLPKNLQELGKQKVQEMKSGVKKLNLYEHITHGGLRKKSE